MLKYLKKTILIILISLKCFALNSQEFKLTELIILLQKNNWNEVNNYLINKNWVFMNSEKKENNVKIIIWAYGKELYTDAAKGFVRIYLYNDNISGISYQTNSNKVNAAIQKSISGAGFRLIKTDISNGNTVTKYENENLYLDFENNNQTYENNYSTAVYLITIIKKYGALDKNNGVKYIYFDDNITLKEIYSLKNGVINGDYKAYHTNGQLKTTGKYINGKENGNFIEYSENGNKLHEFSWKNDYKHGQSIVYHPNGKIHQITNYVNGTLHGECKQYDEQGFMKLKCTYIDGTINGILEEYNENKITIKQNFKNGIKNGLSIKYYYSEDNLYYEEISNYIDEKLNGTKITYRYFNKVKEIYEFSNHNNGIKEGPFKSIENNTLIFGNYNNNLLHGKYIVYEDILLRKGIVNTDSSETYFLEHGYFNMGDSTGNWIFNHTYGKFEINYLNGLRHGKSKYYLPNYSFVNRNEIIEMDNGFIGTTNQYEFSGQLFLEENYIMGKLNGVVNRYYTPTKILIPVNKTLGDAKNDTSMIETISYIKIHEIYTYKDDIKDGEFFLKDSLGKILSQGNFLKGKKIGKWKHFNIISNDLQYHEGEYNQEGRNGEWIQYKSKDSVLLRFNYLNGLLHGKTFKYSKSLRLEEHCIYDHDKLIELAIYDSTGINIDSKFENFQECSKCLTPNLRFQITSYTVNKIIMYEYKLILDDDINNYYLNFFQNFMLDYEDKVVKHGKVKIVNKINGSIINGVMYDNKKTGLWEFIYSDQDIISLKSYNDNTISYERFNKLKNNKPYNGTLIDDNDNEIIEKIKIKKGSRDGNTTYIDKKTGEIILKEKYKVGKIQE